MKSRTVAQSSCFGVLVSCLLITIASREVLAAGKTPTAAEAKAWISEHLEKVRGEKKKKSPAGGFSVESCPKIPSSAWGKLILLGRPVEHELKFGPGCDLEGKLVITMEPFPVRLQVRNLSDLDRVTAQVSIDLEPHLAEQEAKLVIQAEDGILQSTSAQEVLAFVGAYDLTIGLDGKMKKNSGGKVTSQRYRGQPLAVTIPIPAKK